MHFHLFSLLFVFTVVCFQCYLSSLLFVFTVINFHCHLSPPLLFGHCRQYEQEMAVRLGTLPATATAHGGGKDSLAAALKEGLSLDENPQSTPAIRAQSTREIVECLEKYHSELNGAAFRTVLNADKILSRTEHCGAMGAFAS